MSSSERLSTRSKSLGACYPKSDSESSDEVLIIRRKQPKQLSKSSKRNRKTLSSEFKTMFSEIKNDSIQTSAPRKLFQFFNTNLFDSILPKSLQIVWNNRLKSSAGQCVFLPKLCIELSPSLILNKIRLRDILLHEMIHAVAYKKDRSTGHGRTFKKFAQVAHTRIPQIPMVSTCHSYTIKHKYNYTCIDCGYNYGRHRKSLDSPFFFNLRFIFIKIVFKNF